MRRVGTLLLILLFVGPEIARGQTGVASPQPRGMSVRQLVELALARNAELLATRQRTLEAQGLLRQAGFRPNPGVEASVSSGPLLGSPGEHEVTIGYAQTFELGGKLGRRLEVAQRVADLAELEVADRQRELIADVKGRYVDALTALRNLETATRLLALNEQGYRLIQARVAQGEAPRLEQGLLRVEVARFASDRWLFESQADRAVLELKTLAGLNPDEPLSLTDEWDMPPIAISVGDAIERALTARPDLRAARREEDLQQAELRLAQAEAVPDLIGFARYTRVRSQFDQLGLSATGARVPIRDRDNLLSAGVSIALPVRNRNQGNIQAATARANAARLRRGFIEQVVQRQARAAHGRYEAARRALEILDRDAVNQAKENVEVIRASYDLGETRLVDLINEQRRLVDTQRAYTEVAKEYYLAQVELERAVGAPLR